MGPKSVGPLVILSKRCMPERIDRCQTNCFYLPNINEILENL